MNITIALVVLALPLILTNSYTAVAASTNMVEAARGMGMTGNEILFQVELPNAIPLIMSGIRTAWVYTVATAYLAIFAGYATRPGQLGTLGDIIGNPSGESIGGHPRRGHLRHRPGVPRRRRAQPGRACPDPDRDQARQGRLAGTGLTT